MTKYNLEYKDYIYEDLLEALFDKEIFEISLEESEDVKSYRTDLLFTNDNLFLIVVRYATESKENIN